MAGVRMGQPLYYDGIWECSMDHCVGFSSEGASFTIATPFREQESSNMKVYQYVIYQLSPETDEWEYLSEGFVAAESQKKAEVKALLNAGQTFPEVDTDHCHCLLNLMGELPE